MTLSHTQFVLSGYVDIYSKLLLSLVIWIV